MSTTWKVEAIASLIPIHFLIDKHHSKKALLHYRITPHLIAKQWFKIKSLIINTNNYLNKVLPSFDSLNKELSVSFHLVNTFSDHFSFLSVSQKYYNLKTKELIKKKNIELNYYKRI